MTEWCGRHAAEAVETVALPVRRTAPKPGAHGHI
jgi:hypothetical protein